MTVHQLIAQSARTGDLALLYNVLECHRYTRAGEYRALEGYGWAPRELTEDELASIMRAIEETESGLEVDVS